MSRLGGTPKVRHRPKDQSNNTAKRSHSANTSTNNLELRSMMHGGKITQMHVVASHTARGSALIEKKTKSGTSP